MPAARRTGAVRMILSLLAQFKNVSYQQPHCGVASAAWSVKNDDIRSCPAAAPVELTTPCPTLLGELLTAGLPAPARAAASASPASGSLDLTGSCGCCWCCWLLGCAPSVLERCWLPDRGLWPCGKRLRGDCAGSCPGSCPCEGRAGSALWCWGWLRPEASEGRGRLAWCWMPGSAFCSSGSKHQHGMQGCAARRHLPGYEEQCRQLPPQSPD